jgi:hypothetical protein
MKYAFSITFHGEVESTPEEDAMEGIDNVVDVVKESFKIDLQAGVVLQGMAVHVDALRMKLEQTGT